MKGILAIKCGQYVVSDDITLAVRASDAGTVFSIFYRPKCEYHTVIIDEHGQILARGQPDGVSPLAVLNAVLKTGPLPVADPPAKSERKVRVPKRVKLVLADAKPKDRSANHAHVFTGFTDGRVIHVLYRIVLGETKFPFDQLLIDGKKIILAARIPKGNRLTPTRYRQVSYLPEQDTFILGKQKFRKMSLAELRPLLKGRTIQVAPPKSG